MGKQLGQHFLIHSTAAKKIIAALSLKGGDTVLEIGPGHGELTREIKNKLATAEGEREHGQPKSRNTDFASEKSSRIVAIEKDPELARKLREHFHNDPIEIVEGDIRTAFPMLEKKIGPVPYKLVGNIPYYLTGYLLRMLSELRNPPARMVLTIQKEVAERIAAQPPEMNRLAALTQYWADVSIAGILPKSEFQPVPKVDSAIIVLTPRAVTPIAKENYFRMVKILFAQPRKTILNNLLAIPFSGKRQNSEGKLSAPALRSKNKKEIVDALNALHIDPKLRPQNLSVTTIADLSCALF